MTDSPQKKPPRRVTYVVQRGGVTLEHADAVLRESGVRSTAELRDEEEHKAPDREPGR